MARDWQIRQVLKKELGEQHVYISSMSENGLDYDNLTRIVYLPTEKDSPLDVLDNGLRLIQKALQVGDAAPEVWFVLRGTQVGTRVMSVSAASCSVADSDLEVGVSDRGRSFVSLHNASSPLPLFRLWRRPR